MMLPRICSYVASGCDPTCDAEPATEGRSLVLSWFGLVIEITISRVVS